MVDLIDFYGGTFIIYLTSTLEVMGIAWVYGVTNFVNDIEFMLNMKIGFYWKLCWGFVIPVFLTGILIYSLIEENSITYQGQAYPTSAIVSGWLLAVIALLSVPIAGFHSMSKYEGSIVERFFQSMRPAKDYGPRQKKDRAAWLAYKSGLGEQDHIVKRMINRVRRRT